MELTWSAIQDLILVPVGAWAIWITKSVYDMSKDQAVAKVQYQDLKEDLREIKAMLYDLQYGVHTSSVMGVRQKTSPFNTQQQDKDSS